MTLCLRREQDSYLGLGIVPANLDNHKDRYIHNAVHGVVRLLRAGGLHRIRVLGSF